ncbi:MAG: hypothetical protein KGJ62_08270 [Armatimonadetes bacterium]|nr:hypothetical protein [Armatimonadota bacterium]MDE2208067.1 hypothetical protein [Armatimonadota bacterium]
MRLREWLHLFVTLSATAAALCPAVAQQPPRHRVVLVLCDGLEPGDLLRIPSLRRMAATGAVGLLSEPGASESDPAYADLVLAVGARPTPFYVSACAGAGDGAYPREAGTYRTVTMRRTAADYGSKGSEAHGSIYYPGIGRLARNGIKSGWLGAVLQGSPHSLTVKVYGAADTNQVQRAAVLLAMDPWGRADGAIPMSRPSATSPFGLVDAPRALADAATGSGAALTVVQLGDCARAAAAHAGGAIRLAALHRADIFLTRLMQAPDAASRDVLLVSAWPLPDLGAPSPKWNRLSVAAAVGPDFQPGLLTSATTRTPGLVSNVDVAPTVLRLLGAAAPVGMIGRPIHTIASSAGSRIASLLRMDRREQLNAHAVVPVMALIGGLLGISVACCLALAAAGSCRSASFGAGLCVAALNLPAACLLAGLWLPGSVAAYGWLIVGCIAALSLLCTVGAAASGREAAPVAAGIFIVVLLLDLATGQHLMKSSIMSGYTVSGIRLYGIGNEYLGLASAATALGLYARARSYGGRAGRLRIALIALVFLVFGWPELGANSGSLVIGGALLAACVAIERRRPAFWLYALPGAICGAAAAVAAATADAWLLPGSASHAGEALRTASSGGGFRYLGAILLRKARLSMTLARSPWLLLIFGGFAATIAVALAAAERRKMPLMVRGSRLRHALGLVVVVAATALISKDSGVVTCAYAFGVAGVWMAWEVLSAAAGAGVAPHPAQ